MLAFTPLPASSAGAPAAGVLADRAAGSTAGDTASESFASTLSAIAGEAEEAAKDDASPDDSPANPVVPVAEVVNAIAPGVVLGWPVAIQVGDNEGLQGETVADPESDQAKDSITPFGTRAANGSNAGVATFTVGAATRSDAGVAGQAAGPSGQVFTAVEHGDVPGGSAALDAASRAIPGSQVATQPAVGAQAVDTFTASSLAETLGDEKAGGARLPETFVPGDGGEPSASATDAASDAGAATSPTPAVALHVRSGLADELRQALASSGEDATSSRGRGAHETTPAASAPDLAVGARQSRDGSLSFDFSGNSGLAKAFSATVKASATSFASALANVPEFEALPSETANQIVQALRMQFARGGGEAQIRLSPQHFGELKVSIKVEQGQVTARLEAEVPAVREWLQTNQSLLRSSLAEQRLTLDHLEVSEPHESQDAEREREHTAAREERQKQQRRRRRDDTGEIFEVVA